MQAARAPNIPQPGGAPLKILAQVTRIMFVTVICITPPAMADSKYPALRESVDPELQKAFNKALSDHFGTEFWQLAKTKKVGLAIAMEKMQ